MWDQIKCKPTKKLGAQHEVTNFTIIASIAGVDFDIVRCASPTTLSSRCRTRTPLIYDDDDETQGGDDEQGSGGLTDEDC